MTGTAHYREAEALLNQAASEFLKGNDPGHALAAAQVHATLALAAAQGSASTEEPSRKRYRLTEDHLQQVANVYGDAADAGEGPTLAVASCFGVPHSTAAKWVGHARKRHFLNAVEDGAR